ncbi:MAG: phosphoribosylformylglycinamidine synthase I [Chloroflexi bacterium GWB2_49_20]|nr:MAG: phosphoribosylformylglycinamidine synthase I [Chloroflexi bacterium GWB2_49_20]OGN77955.1 MAG: phosphoribosylformylglycinamidine synthase I [Chloroflexi bacterium GWC2_49_37]OGN84993.1 MAG: phosphoribosylformylglycinamidine synthase I [Chloroflexi bacterium GWD2_49_16]HBG74978.1 phosphoribosylformylglycinamidine synthase I [Anaerolineae bacterium]HCC78298.1 phosphoribosylformylglycinamidine synthase I [Anaerolineae bacterium]
MKPKALILQARGSNRDLDVMEALTLSGAEPIGVPLNHLRSRTTDWHAFQMLVIPGGFSYADALGAGKLLALDLNSYFADEINAFVASGKPVIGICNGFQALLKSGILPEGNDRQRASTLTFNTQGHFECRWVTLAPLSQTCIWTKGLNDNITCPVAHGEGNFQVSDLTLINTLSSLDQIALTYTHPDGSPANGEYPANPNGSVLDIAGICNPQGNVLGLMPHPENHIHPTQHPQWSRDVSGQTGLGLFENGIKYAAGL